MKIKHLTIKILGTFIKKIVRKNRLLQYKIFIQYKLIKILRGMFSPNNNFFNIQLLITGFIFFEAVEDSILLFLYGNAMNVENSWIIPIYSFFTVIVSVYSLLYDKFRNISIWFIIIFFSSYFVCKFLDFIPPILDEYNYGIYFYMLLITLVTRAKILALKKYSN